MNTNPSTSNRVSRLEEKLFEALELIDAGLASESEPVHSRPLIATSIFVEECVVAVSGNSGMGQSVDWSGGEYLDKEWFGALVRSTTRWYADRYGWDLLKSPQQSALALVQLFSTPFQLKVPLVPTSPGPEEGMQYVYFTDRILEDEDPLTWLIDTPKIEALPKTDFQRFYKSVVKAATRTRRLDRSISWAVLEAYEAQNLAATVVYTLEKAVEGICSVDAAVRSAAVWDLHLVLEKILKVLIYQKGDVPSKTHDLKALRVQAQSLGLSPANEPGDLALPSHTDAIRYRYGELQTPTLQQLINAYDYVLEAATQVAASLEREPLFKGREWILIQALPWHPSRKKKLR